MLCTAARAAAVDAVAAFRTCPQAFALPRPRSVTDGATGGADAGAAAGGVDAGAACAAVCGRAAGCVFDTRP